MTSRRWKTYVWSVVNTPLGGRSPQIASMIRSADTSRPGSRHETGQDRALALAPEHQALRASPCLQRAEHQQLQRLRGLVETVGHPRVTA